jgi:uncharacterized membrane protein
MAALTVLKFATPTGAEEQLDILQNLQKQRLISIHDAAMVIWPENKKKPKTRQLHNMAGVGALTGSFWGMLFGMLFLVPFLGAAIGAGIGALTNSFVDVGIDDNFIKRVRAEVTPGTSALFLLSSGAVLDRVAEAMKVGPAFEIISTNLSQDQENALRAAFEEEEPETPEAV